MSLFSWFMAQIYDRSIQKAEMRCLRQWRSELLHNLSGNVLEIGCGTGLNLEFYPKTVTHLTLLEPDANMRKKLQDRVLKEQNLSQVEIVACGAETMTAPDASYDAVVSTLVMCSVKDLQQVLSEIYRILKPGGQLIFIEHVAAQNNPQRLKWQKRLEPLWTKIACNCHLTRDTEKAIVQAGFTFKEISRQSMRGVPPIVRPSIKGIAFKSNTINN